MILYDNTNKQDIITQLEKVGFVFTEADIILNSNCYKYVGKNNETFRFTFGTGDGKYYEMAIYENDKALYFSTYLFLKDVDDYLNKYFKFVLRRKRINQIINEHERNN
jgi:hypothetical protein